MAHYSFKKRWASTLCHLIAQYLGHQEETAVNTIEIPDFMKFAFYPKTENKKKKKAKN